MAEGHRKFDREFRKDAVRIVRETVKPIAPESPNAAASTT